MAPLYSFFFIGVDERIFLPLLCERPNAMRKTSTLLKNLNNYDKNPAPPPPRPGEYNLTLITKTYCIVLFWPPEHISTSSNKTLQPNPW